MTNQPAAPAPGPAPEPQHAYYERMFNAAVVALAEISEALGITDEEALAANGNDLILERINELKQALRYMGCNCPGESKRDKNLHAPNCPYRAGGVLVPLNAPEPLRGQLCGYGADLSHMTPRDREVILQRGAERWAEILRWAGNAGVNPSHGGQQ